MGIITLLLHADPASGEAAVVGISSKDNEGIVVLNSPFKTHSWSSVCPTAWDDGDADVVCRQLGFLGGVSTLYT